MERKRLLRHLGQSMQVPRVPGLLLRGLQVSQNYGYLFGGSHNKDYSILGSILGSPSFGKRPFKGLTLPKQGDMLDKRVSEI